MLNIQNIIGNKYNKLEVLEYSHKKRNKHYWKCLCECGENKIVETHNLLNGNSKSCGGRIHRIVDLTGNTFGRLTVIKYSRSDDNFKSYWDCMCVCGNSIEVRGDSLTDNNTKSCGCLNMEAKYFIHGLHGTKLYQVWGSAKDRCNNPNSKAYIHYGERGIMMCETWSSDYVNFQQWAMLNGYEEGLTLERVDVNGNYCPENCCWIPQLEQSNNTRRNINIEFNGETHNVNQWAKIYNINKNTLRYRINNNWDLNKAFNIN